MKQLQNYIKYHRVKNGDNDDIEVLKEYIKKNSSDEGSTNGRKMFLFGEKVNHSETNSDFYLGFTSEELLRRVTLFNNQGTFHLDATYKIVKYSYPLIVFGFTDLN